MLEVNQTSDEPEVTLIPDQPRGTDKFWSDLDLNGLYYIQTFDDYEAPTRGQYAHVLFSLEMSQPLFDTDVYILGGFNNWELLPQYKMEYEDRYSAYFGEATLKQGVYDYLYAAVPKSGGPPDFEVLEGNWHETENYYTILVYYRPFGQRFDRLIGVTTISEK